MVKILERNVGEIRRFAINFLNLPLGQYQNFTALTSPGLGLRLACFHQRSRDLFACETRRHSGLERFLILAVNKIWIGFRIGLRIGLVSSLLLQNYYFEKKLF